MPCRFEAVLAVRRNVIRLITLEYKFVGVILFWLCGRLWSGRSNEPAVFARRWDEIGRGRKNERELWCIPAQLVKRNDYRYVVYVFPNIGNRRFDNNGRIRHEMADDMPQLRQVDTTIENRRFPLSGELCGVASTGFEDQLLRRKRAQHLCNLDCRNLQVDLATHLVAEELLGRDILQKHTDRNRLNATVACRFADAQPIAILSDVRITEAEVSATCDEEEESDLCRGVAAYDELVFWIGACFVVQPVEIVGERVCDGGRFCCVRYVLDGCECCQYRVS